MNIGIVTTWFERGAAYVSKQYADVLNEKHDIFIFARGGESFDKESEHWKTYPVTWGKRYKASSTQVDWLEFKNWVTKNKIEVVIFNEQQDWEIIADAKRLNIKTIAYIDYYTETTIPLFDLYDAVICNTKRHLEALQSHKGAKFIPWGTNVDLFKQGSLQDFGKPVFFHSAGMGGINLRKGTDKLVNAFSRLTGDVELVIHSQVPESAYGETGELIKKDNRIRFVEKSVPPPGLYHMGNIYVYPTKLEGIGLTICEALAMGLPVITTNNAPMNEFVEHGKTGRLVAVEKFISRADGYYWPQSIVSEESLQNEMQFFIDHYDELSKYQAHARAAAENKFNWAKNAKELLNVVEQVKKMESKYDGTLVNKALGYAFEQREKKWLIFTKVIRKIKRKLKGLN